MQRAIIRLGKVFEVDIEKTDTWVLLARFEPGFWKRDEGMMLAQAERVRACPDAVVILVTNPVDVLTRIAIETSVSILAQVPDHREKAWKSLGRASLLASRHPEAARQEPRPPEFRDGNGKVRRA